jgi:hypothetical protein
MSNFKGLYDIRDYKESDKNFILATFLRGLYYGDSWFSSIPKDIFMDSYGRVANRLVSDPRVSIKLAVLREDPDVILGYSLVSKDQQAIIWAYTKSAWRKQGIARSLIPSNPLYVMHLSELGKQLLPKLPSAVFNPFYE